MKDNDFTSGSIAGKLIRFMFPVLGALVLQAMYGAVDLLVVGRFGTTAGLSAVSTGSQVLNLVTFVITGLAMGVTVEIGHALGEERRDKIGPVIAGSVVVFGLIALVLFLIMVPFSHGIAVLMQAPEEAVDLTSTYIRICGAGIFFIIAYNVISAIFRGLGDSKTPLLFVLIACIINVVGDLVLVAGFHMNVAGAAIATVAAQAVSVVLSLVIMKRSLPYRLERKDFRFNPEIRAAMQVGMPLGLQELLTQISFMALCAFVNRLGLEASSGYGIASKIVSFVMLVPSSLNQSMSSFVSQNASAGREDRARRAMFTGMGIGIIIGVIIYLGIYFKGDFFAGFFSTDEAAVQNGWDYLKGFAPEAIVTAVLFSFNGYFNGHDKSVFIMVSGILQTFAVRLPLAYYESVQPHASLTKIGLAAPCATVFGIVMCVIYYFIFQKELKQKKQVIQTIS